MVGLLPGCLTAVGGAYWGCRCVLNGRFITWLPDSCGWCILGLQMCIAEFRITTEDGNCWGCGHLAHEFAAILVSEAAHGSQFLPILKGLLDGCIALQHTVLL